MDIGKLLLVGGIGYVAYEYFLAPKSATAPAVAPGVQPAPVAQAAVNPITTQSLVQAAAAKDNFTVGTVDQWDWYYGLPSARGIPAPDPSAWGFTDANRGEQLTFPEWWNIASAHGMSGLDPWPVMRGGLLKKGWAL